ncbi:MAG TPA: TAXI family TRAP transporter solute-binding subunit [Burkholderiales bacterium]|nr:TAXI family TRAP transporter solute-binding subunit [Burkholderiales bacterium]
MILRIGVRALEAMALCSLFALAPGGLDRAQGAEPVVLVLGTATPGGGFTAYGEALVETLSTIDSSLAIRLRSTAGSQENIPLLESGAIDLGLVEGTAAHEALSGIGRTPARLSVVAAMYPTPALFAVRADSPHRTIGDLRGQRVVFGAAGSGFVLAARYVLDGLRLDLAKDFDAVLLQSAKDGPPMVLNGEAAAMWGGGSGWPPFQQIADAPKGARFIAPTAEEIARIRARHPFLKPMTLPAGSYRGQDRDIATIGTWSLILARPDLPEEVVYRFVRALHRSQPALGERLAQAEATTPAATLVAVPLARLHSGTARYLREVGLTR